MAKPADLNALRAMENEALQCERADDVLGALDIYEDICRSEWAGAKHLTALGHCYLKNRQRQNAKEAWLRAITYEPNYEPCLEALNKYFPGWQKHRDKQSTKSPVAAANLHETPPPPPNAFDETQYSSLTMEMIPPTSAQEPPARATAVAEPPPPPHVPALCRAASRAPAGARARAPAQCAPGASGARIRRAQGQTRRGGPRLHGQKPAGGQGRRGGTGQLGLCADRHRRGSRPLQIKPEHAVDVTSVLVIVIVLVLDSACRPPRTVA